MLDLAFIRQNPEAVRAAIAQKRCDADLDALLESDRARRELLQVLETKRGRRNQLAAQIPKAPALEKAGLIEEAKGIRTEIERLEPELWALQARLDDLLLRMPSLPRPEVPIGRGEEDNVELRKVGAPRTFEFKPREHVELMAGLGLIDWDGPRNFAGGRSYALKGDGALLELAVCRLAVDILRGRGLELVLPPVMVREPALVGTGFFPLGRDEAYAIEADGLFLVGTSEVALVSLHAGQILEASRLPIRYAGMSPCFRREAGAHGRDTRGVYRVHQFTKVEQVVFCEPSEEVAEREHYALLANAEAILEALEIPYRVCLACTGEIGLGQTRKHEVESWMPGRGAYAETHSCSTLGDFQARRSNIRIRRPDGSLAFPYTLNNTAVASPRILIPLLENYQNEDGSVTLPRRLVPYMGGIEVLRPKP